MLPLLQWRKLPGSVPGGFFSYSFILSLPVSLCSKCHSLCSSSSCCEKYIFLQRRVEQGCFQSLLTDILNKELVLLINESEFALSKNFLNA